MKHIDWTSFDTWFHGLVAALLSAIGLTGTDYIASALDGQPVNWAHLGSVLGVSSLGAAFLYLRQTPLPTMTVQGPGVVRIEEGTTASVVTAPTK